MSFPNNNYFCRVNKKTMKLKSLNPIKSKTVLYQDCNDTTLDVWLNIMRTKDLKYLVLKGSIPSQSVLESQMEKINSEFMALRGQNTTITVFDKIQYREQLILKVNFCFQLVDRIAQRSTQGLLTVETLEGFVEELKRWGFRINRDKPLLDELQNITNELKALQTTIDVLQEEIYPEQDETVSDEQKGALAFDKMLLSYQRILGIGKIVKKETTLAEFVVIEQSVKEEYERRKKSE
jgi:hypothetical protein